MASKLKFETRTSTIADAISSALCDLTGLAEECREVVDNAGEGLSQTQRIQTLDETATQLESINEPDVDAALGAVPLTYQYQVSNRKGRQLSRSSRCSSATGVLDTVISTLETFIDDEANKGKTDEAESLKEELERIKDDAEGCEFPGMYG